MRGALLHQFFTRVKGVGHSLLVRDSNHASFVLMRGHARTVKDEPTADGEILHVLCQLVALGIPSVKNQAVGVFWHRLGVELHLILHAADRTRDGASQRDFFPGFRRNVCAGCRRRVSDKAKQNRAVGAVANTSGGKRATKCYAHLRRQLRQGTHKRLGCAHRAHRV